MIAKIWLGHICLREENLSFINISGITFSIYAHSQNIENSSDFLRARKPESSTGYTTSAKVTYTCGRCQFSAI